MKSMAWVFWRIVFVGAFILVLTMAEASSADRFPGEVVERETLVGIIETHIQRGVGDPRKRVEVKEVRGYEKMVSPPGDFRYEVLVQDQAYRGGTVPVDIRFLIDGKEVKKLRVTAQVHIFADVIVARSYIRKHQVIQDRDLQRVNKDLSLLPPDVVTDMEELLGKRTTLTMNSNEVFRKGMVERAPIVKKGDRMTLVVENNHFKITSLGEVQEEGGKGDRVRLVNVSSKKEIYGRILDANTAQIDY